MTERFIDPHMSRKKEIIKNNVKTVDGFPKPAIVEFNLTGLCNRTCSFCPRADSKVFPNTNEFLEVSLFEKIMRDLAEIDYDSRIIFSAFSEPLLHKKVEELIAAAKRHLQAGVEIVTNGDHLTEKRLKSLFDAGLDLLSVSMYDGAHQIDEFMALKDACHLRDDQFILRRRYMENGNIGITFSNRAGMANIEEYKSEEDLMTPLPLQNPCFYPHYLSLIDHNGNMLLCTHDWSKSVVIGNLAQAPFWTLWRSRRLEMIRKTLGEADRNFSPCEKCDVIGTLMGEENYLAWNTYHSSLK